MHPRIKLAQIGNDLANFIEPLGPKRLRVLVTGERTFSNSYPMWFILSYVKGVSTPRPTLIHGAARGADTLAAHAATLLEFHVRAYPADWERYGRGAGPIRNQQMLTEGKPDLVIAFFVNREHSKGTNHMVKISKYAGLPCIIWEENKGWVIE